MSAWYRTGTISVPNGSTTLTGSGTAFVANVSAGMMVVANNQVIGEVAAVVSNTQITLAVAYAGTTLTGANYAIANLGAVRNSLIAAVQDLTALVEDAQDGALSGRFGDGTLSEPGMAFAGDIDTGFYRPGANRIAATKVLEAPSFGGAGVQSSPTDATAGRVLTVGAFGLGGEIGATPLGVLTNIANLGSLVNLAIGGFQGLVTMSGVAGIPNGDYGTFVWPRRLRPVVFFHDNVSSGLYYTQVGGGGVIAPIRKLFDSANLLGTVSQSGGVPTGAVIERGSNANGEYVRFADGTQICTQTIAVSSGVQTAFGSLFVSDNYSWTFPAAFAVAPAVGGNGAALITTVLLGLGTSATSETSTSIRLMRGASTATAGSANVLAVGRWF